MMGAPSVVGARQLRDVHIRLSGEALETHRDASAAEKTDMNSEAAKSDIPPQDS